MPTDDLAAWIAGVRRRLESGELAGHEPIPLSSPAETLTDVERGVRVMLGEVAFFASLSEREKRIPHFAAGRAKLARDLRALREWLG